jgi:hypothetical protein
VHNAPGLSISVIESKTKGAPTAILRRGDGREFFLHSRFDPLDEARFLVKDVARRERTLYIVLGFGLGYHVKELLQRVPQSSHIIVLEPNSACLSGRILAEGGNQAKAWMLNSRLHFSPHQDPKLAPFSLTDRMAALRLLSLELFTHIPSTITDEQFYRSLLAEIRQNFPPSFHSRMSLLDTMLENHLQNFWANLPHSWNAAPVQNLRGKWSGRPLIIVSAGPSLNVALPILREIKGEALLLATGPTAGILTAHQIQPDLVITFDPFEANLGHFLGWDSAGIPLVYYHVIHRGILQMYRGPRFCFVMQDDAPLPLSTTSEKPDFWQGGSVAFSALQLAHHLDANPIIFVGQDFAFAGGHTHAGGCFVDQTFDIRALPADYIFVPGVDGNPVVTSRIYYSYLLYMQNYLFDFARRKPDVKHINTSRIGARIQGMDYLDLEQALNARQAHSQVPAREMISSALRRDQRIPQEARQAALRKWISELEQLLAMSANTDKLDNLFRKFRATSVYAQASKSYDDVHYVHEVRCRGDNIPAHTAAFLTRFKEHLQFVREELHKAGAGI